MEPLSILYQDEDLIAINKPHGLLVHPSKIARDAQVFANVEVRKIVGKKVYPVHRLDRKTSGVLLFAKNAKANSFISSLFMNRQVTKHYEALVRGYVLESGVVDYPLSNEGKEKDAITSYRPLDWFEVDVPFGKFETSRYTFLSLSPETGRFHQIRKHMAHLRHPIIGDRPHGCNKQNRLWKEEFGMDKMLLHACSLSLHIDEERTITIEASRSKEFNNVLSLLHSRKSIK